MTARERWTLRLVLAALGHPPVTVSLWNGEEIQPPEKQPRGRLRIRDRDLLRRALPDMESALADAYVDGRVEVDGDLVRLLEAVFRAGSGGRGLRRGLSRIASLRLPGASRRRARENIHHHYDIGNDFYRLWLDERLVYTCAYFPSPEASLEEAQLAKMDHVCRKVALQPDEHVVEAGCGWGSLALHMAEHYGARVRAYNISEEQVRYARERARSRGLARRVEFVQDDYRAIRDRCDAFVSVGMLEHVGPRHYPTLSRVIDRCLLPHGRGLVHSIGRAHPQPMSRWLERRIFPGAYIPALRQMMSVFEPRGFAVLDVENLRLHYAKTLEHWLDRFEKAADRVAAMYDARFVRQWRLYLAGSIAAFQTGSCQLYQVVFSRADNDRIPWTRAPVYTDYGMPGSRGAAPGGA